MSQAEDLNRGISQLGLDIPSDVQRNMLQYIELLQKWNKVFNLTAIREPDQMVSYHLLDSLAVLPHLWAGHWLDVGCGAGLPGLVLAMARPDWQFTLLDSNSKKTSFVQQAVIELNLKNVSVCCARVEDWTPLTKFDAIISRAFTGAGDFVAVTRHLLNEGGRWVAMKGQPDQELQGLPSDIRIERIIQLEVPTLDAARCLLLLKVN
jgi:16S rRNA (guanine527-N7)-methyltransferase